METLNEIEMNDLKSIPWKLVSLNNENYAIKFLTKHNNYMIMMTDFKKIYFEIMKSEELEDASETFNPGLEIPQNQILNQISCIIDDLVFNTSKVNSIFDLKQDKEVLKLLCTANLADIEFCWEFTVKEDSILLYEHLSQPLIKMIAELQRRQNELMNLLVKKDAEIENYKFGGATLTHPNLGTDPFSETMFISNMNDLIEDAWNSSLKIAFNEKNNDLYAAINLVQQKANGCPGENKVATVNKTELLVKEEKSTTDEEIKRREELKRRLQGGAQKKKTKKKFNI